MIRLAIEGACLVLLVAEIIIFWIIFDFLSHHLPAVLWTDKTSPEEICFWLWALPMFATLLGTTLIGPGYRWYHLSKYVVAQITFVCSFLPNGQRWLQRNIG